MATKLVLESVTTTTPGINKEHNKEHLQLGAERSANLFIHRTDALPMGEAEFSAQEVGHSPPRPGSQSDHHNLVLLPAELHLHIAHHLPYPDLLSLRLTHPSFYYSPLLATSGRRYVPLKVSWLIERKTRGLSYPTKQGLEFMSDSGFVRNGEVKEILRRRRRHGDCGPGGCEVLVGRRCEGWKGDGSGRSSLGFVSLLKWRLSGEIVLAGAMLVVAIVIASFVATRPLVGFANTRMVD